MNPQPHRYSPRPLPAYRYTPGSGDPHPVRHPAGHSYSREIRAEKLDPSRWRECESYLYAVDLFNEAYWWESHEVLEALWKGSGARSSVGQFLQGLIQLAAACLKRRAGNADPAARLLERGSPVVLAAGGKFLGVATARLVSDVGSYVRTTSAPPPQIRLADL
ncbi:MAG: DUF309 domain-containing protein [Candidatus Binatia bacterium]